MTQQTFEDYLNPEEAKFFSLGTTTTPIPAPKADLKAALGGKKPQLTHCPIGPLTWASRAFQYGDEKYERGNMYRPAVDARAEFDRFGEYLDAALRHLMATTTMIEYVRGNTDLNGAALFIGGYPDTESRLPHLAHALCSLMIAVQLGINAGLLSSDPGTAWRNE